MKKLTLITTLMFCVAITQAQTETLKEKLARKLKEAKDQKIEKTIDKALGKSEEKLDKSVNGVIEGKEKKNKADKENTEETSNTSNQSGTSNANTSPSAKISATSKFDFISGEKVLYYDDFSRVAVGDFPADINTNASGEVVTLEGKEGKWLNMTKNGAFIPDNIKNLPENFTLEFEVGIDKDPSNNYSGLGLNFNINNDQLFKDMFFAKGTSIVYLHPGAAQATISIIPTQGTDISNEIPMPQWDVNNKTFAKVSIWRQKGRLRVYVDQDKLIDIPRFFTENQVYGFAFFRNFFRECNVFIGNIKYAIAPADTRSKLITEGKFVTRGILFDVNSDQIKPESNGVLKEIAAVLQENPTVKVKIIGHTDSDGNAALNLDLSKQRSAAVKNALSTVFGVDASRLETDGKGAAEPSEPNTTPQGKANNRRVEFIKL
ncbi:OmpA family protein [Pedobacter alpinus]|uniref:OmpA family protein n=1 Tax=Pedobacter alpinus TaxID=1590643 RepID=A0ABW5TW30_9SPHI